MTRSIRKGNIPANVILFTLESSAPIKFALDNNEDLMPRNTTGSSTNDNITTPAHTHPASGTHEHDTSVTHSHAALTGSYTGSAGSGSYYGSAGIHSHPYTSATSTATMDTAADGNHTHATTSTADPPFYTFLQLKKTTVYNLRTSHQVPFKSCVMRYDNIVPPSFVNDTTAVNKYYKGTAVPNNTGGETTHTHGSVSGHAHTFTLPSHTHTLPTNTETGDNTTTKIGAGSATVTPSSGHTHPLDNVSWSSEVVTGSVVTSDSHSELAVARDPAWFGARIARRDSISMRKFGIPKSSIVMWKESIASIPAGFALTNGSNGTPNLLGKFAKIQSSAGSTGGSDTHQHAAQSHTHNITAVHTHTITGNTEQNVYSGSPASAGSSAGSRMNQHTHLPGVVTSTIWATTATGSTSHQHGTATSLPNYKQVAYLYKTS